jgi:hypothetical protein
VKKLLRGLNLKILYPALMFIGAFLKNRKEPFQRFVIDLNNKLVEMDHPVTDRILVLLPHCLQIDECKIRLTHDIYNCARCGKCEIKDLIAIAEEYRLKLFVATGGTLARKIVRDIRPEAIIAVACERDLSSGIVDTFPLPIIGIPNERPFGPCFNTRVDLERVRKAIRFFGDKSGTLR